MMDKILEFVNFAFFWNWHVCLHGLLGAVAGRICRGFHINPLMVLGVVFLFAIAVEVFQWYLMGWKFTRYGIYDSIGDIVFMVILCALTVC